MGATEEAGKVAGAVVESLKGSPLSLALVLFNIVFLIIVYYGTTGQREINEKLMTMLVENQHKTAELLFKCSPTAPQQRSDFVLPLPYKLDLIK